MRGAPRLTRVGQVAKVAWEPRGYEPCHSQVLVHATLRGLNAARGGDGFSPNNDTGNAGKYCPRIRGMAPACTEFGRLAPCCEALGRAAGALELPVSAQMARGVQAAENAWRDIESEFGMLTGVAKQASCWVLGAGMLFSNWPFTLIPGLGKCGQSSLPCWRSWKDMLALLEAAENHYGVQW